MLAGLAPWGLAEVTLEIGADDSTWSSTDGHFLSGFHLVAEVSEATLGVHLKLLLSKADRYEFKHRRLHNDNSVMTKTSTDRNK